MFERQYHNKLLNDISLVVQNSITVLSLVVNAMLLRIIFTSSHQQKIGAYRYLIATCASSDILYTIIHYLVYPVSSIAYMDALIQIPEMYGNSFIMGGHGLFGTLLGCAVYSGVYAQASAILAFHFIYRTLNIRSSGFSLPLFVAAMIFATVLMNVNGFWVMYFLFVPDEDTLYKNSQLFSGMTDSPVIHITETAKEYVQALYWTNGTFSRPRWNTLLGAVDAVMLIVITYSVIIFCAYLINKYLKENVASSKTMSLQRQLFRSLACQAIYPFITTYSPLAITILFPVIGINFNWIPIMCPPMCVSHPLFDALALIFCISDYRSMFLRSIGLSKCVRKRIRATTSISQGVKISTILHS